MTSLWKDLWDRMTQHNIPKAKQVEIIFDLMPYPSNWPKKFNGSSEPCDMLEGPCSCGAWHTRSEWPKVSQ